MERGKRRSGWSWGAALVAGLALAVQARATEPTESGPSGPDFGALSEGDRAWWAGNRGVAVADWRRALASTDTSGPGLALEAMVRIRLLQVSGNLGPFFHEVKIDRALLSCPETEGWCRIAEADRELFFPAFTGADPANVPGILAAIPADAPPEVRAAAAGRLAMALGQAPSGPLDGFGEGLQASGLAHPPDPGTWVLGLGVGGARGAGVGGVVRFVHPDLGFGGHRLEVLATGDSRGGFGLASSFVAAGSPAPLATLSASRLVADRWVDDAPVPYQLAVGRLSLGGLVRRGAISASVAAVGRVEAEDLADPSLLAGPAAALTLASATTTVRFAGEADFGAYTWVGLTLDARAHTPIGHGELAGRVLATGVPTPDVPFHRLPTAGGAELLRGLPAGRFRAPTLYALQIEGRYPIVGPLHAAAFVDAARVEGDHFTAGGGLRLVLPPGRDNVTRVDVGFGPEGWGVVVAWGEAL